jgi:amino acid transporter
MATLTSACAAIAGKFGSSTEVDRGRTIGIITSLLVVTLVSNLIGVKLYGRIERVLKWFKLLLILTICILMVAINMGTGGPRTGSRLGNYTQMDLPPYFRPDGFLNIAPDNTDRFDDARMFGIPGTSGRFLSVWTAVILGVFACMGGDLVIVTAGEAKRPRADLPNAARFMYLVPIGLYVLTSLLVGFNINYTDPDLARPYSTHNSAASHSPFIIVAKTTSLKIVPDFLRACFLISAYSAANTGLYVSSRTLFALAQQYGNKQVRNTLGKTNDGHTPIAAILCSSCFGLLAFLGLADESFNQPILSLAAFFTGAISCVYVSQCIAFLRFKAGLTNLHRLDIYSRDSVAYKKYHYRSRWQPWFAWLGLIGSLLIALTSGWPAAYIMSARDRLASSKNLKQNHLLAWDLVGAYSGPILFLILYTTFKLVNGTRIRSLRELTLDNYILPNFPGDEDQECQGSKPQLTAAGGQRGLVTLEGRVICEHHGCNGSGGEKSGRRRSSAVSAAQCPDCGDEEKWSGDPRATKKSRVQQLKKKLSEAWSFIK